MIVARVRSWARSPGSVATAALVAGSLGLTGCGEQDLYEPPESEYDLIATLALPSQAQDVSVVGTTALIAAGQSGLVVVDVSNPRAPAILSTIDTHKYAESVLAASVPTPGYTVTDIAFVVEGTEGITTYNFTDPFNATSYQQGTTAVDGNGLCIDVTDDPAQPYVVYLAENWKGLRIFESDPQIPGLLRYDGVFTSTRGYAKAVAVEGGFAYVADDEMGLAVVDARVRELGAVQVVSACDTPGNCQGIAIRGGYAYLADGRNGLVVARINGADTPVVVGHLLLDGDCKDIVVRDTEAFLAAKDAGIYIVDISAPSHPVLAGQVVTSYATGIDASEVGIVVASDRDMGIIVLRGPSTFHDTVTPSTVRDLTAFEFNQSTMLLRWHAPGNNGFQGTCLQYDLRYSTEPITPENWASAASYPGMPVPARSGAMDSVEVTGLSPATQYYFAVSAGDASANWAPMSNVTTAFTPAGNVPPFLSGATLTPQAGDVGTVFTFEVVYTDRDSDPPTEALVYIDGAAQVLAQISGVYRHGALYRYETAADLGLHEHYFSFANAQNPPVATPLAPGPQVGHIVFRMGSPETEPGRDIDETLHGVVLTRDVTIATTEVTQAEYEAVMGSNPSHHVGPNLPVENVTWYDAIAYCNALSARDALTPAYTINGSDVTWNMDAGGYRLPTEAEWEWACRGGTESALPTGSLVEEYCGFDPLLDQLGWYCGNAGAGPHAVGLKQANGAGLRDMCGNVWEWCWDWYQADLGTATVVDPTGPGTGSQRVIRGGSWFYYARDCRSASRAPYWPNSGDDVVGFRVARTLR